MLLGGREENIFCFSFGSWPLMTKPSFMRYYLWVNIKAVTICVSRFFGSQLHMWDYLSYLFIFVMSIFYGSSVRTPLGRILRLSSSKWGSWAPPGAASLLPLVAKGSLFRLSWMFGLFALMLIRWLLGDAAKGQGLKLVCFFPAAMKY